MFKDKLLKELEKNPDQTITQLKESMGVDFMFLSGFLSALAEVGILREVEVGRAKLYRVVK